MEASLDHISSEYEQEISEKEWLERTHGVHKMKVIYTLEGVRFEGGSQWKDPEDNVQTVREAWAHCCIRDEAGTDRHLQLTLGFTRFSNDIKLDLRGTDGDKPTAILGGLINPPMGFASRSDLNSYCAAISASINSVPPTMLDRSWVTPLVMRRYEALIEKVVSASLQELGHRPRETHQTTCDEDSVSQQPH